MSKFARHTPTLSGSTKVRALSLDSALLPHVGDAITALTNDDEWEQVGDTVSAVVAACKESVESWYSDMLIGQVASFVSTAPAGWLALDGSTHAQGDYPELFDKLPSAWIDGTDFTLPDVEDVFTSGVGSGGVVGSEGGENNYALTVGQLPGHTHGYTMPNVSVDTIGAGPPLAGTPTVTPDTPTGSTGSGDSIDNRPAWLALVMAVYAGRE